MKTLAIDFRPPARWPMLASAALATLALALCAASIERYLAHRQAAQEQELALGRVETARDPVAADGDGELATQLRQAKAAEISLATDWNALFDSLEAVPLTDVAMLTLHADASAGTVAIESEARDIAALQAYVMALGRAGTLAKAHLVSHQGGPESGQGGVAGLRFAVQASWPAAARSAPGPAQEEGSR